MYWKSLNIKLEGFNILLELYPLRIQNILTFPTEGPGQKMQISILIELLTSCELPSKSLCLFAPLCPYMYVTLKASIRQTVLSPFQQ